MGCAASPAPAVPLAVLLPPARWLQARGLLEVVAPSGSPGGGGRLCVPKPGATPGSVSPPRALGCGEWRSFHRRCFS